MDIEKAQATVDEIRSSELFDAIERFDQIMSANKVDEETFKKFIDKDVFVIIDAARKLVLETDAIIGRNFSTLSSIKDAMARLGYVNKSHGVWQKPGEFTYLYIIAVADNPQYFTVTKQPYSVVAD